MELNDKQMATVVLSLMSTVDHLTNKVAILEGDLKWSEDRVDEYRQDHDKVISLEDDLVRYRNENSNLRSSLSVAREELYQERNKLYQANAAAQYTLFNIKEIRDIAFANVPGLKQAVDFWRNGQKINAIKVVRETTGFGLKEAKDFCEKFCPMYVEPAGCPACAPL